LLGAKKINANAIRAIIELLVVHDRPRAGEALAIVSRRANELTENALSGLRAELGPFIRQILAAPAHPLYLSAQLLAARLQLEGIEVSLVRSRFSSREQAENVRLQALESMIAFRDDALLQTLPPIFASERPDFLRRVLD